MAGNREEITVGIKGEIRKSLHKSIKKWIVDEEITLDEFVARAIEDYASRLEIEKNYATPPKSLGNKVKP